MMNVMRLTAASVFMLLSGIAYSQEKPFMVKGQIANLPDGVILQMTESATQKEEKPLAESVAKNGIFEFKGVLVQPRLFYVKIKGDTWAGFPLLVEPGKITVKGKLEGKSIKDKDAKFQEIKVAGSKSHEQYKKNGAVRERLGIAYEAYHTNNADIIKQMDEARLKKDTVLQKQLIQTEAYKKFEADEKEFFTSVQKSTDSLIMVNKNSWWGPFTMLTELSYLTPEEKRYYDVFSDEAKNSYYGQIVKANLYPVSKIGKPAPSFAFDSTDSRTFASIINGKKYLLVDFWASWCGPCRKQLPALKAFYEEMKEKGVEIVSVSIDKKEADWQKALEEEKMPWPNLLDRESVSNEWGVKSIPAMFLIDANGTVITENVGLDEVRKKIVF